MFILDFDEINCQLLVLFAGVNIFPPNFTHGATLSEFRKYDL